MSDAPPTSGGGQSGDGGGEGGGAPRKRRRRRGGGGGGGGESGERGSGSERAASGDRAGSSEAQASGERTGQDSGGEGARRKRSRRRRGGDGPKGESAGGAQSGPAQQPQGESAQPGSGDSAEGDGGRRKRRRRGGRETQGQGGDSRPREARDDAPRGARDGGRDGGRSRRPEGGRDKGDRAEAASLEAVDNGWDVEPAQPTLRGYAAEPEPTSGAFGDGDGDDDGNLPTAPADISPDENDDPNAPPVKLEADLNLDASATDSDRLTGLDGDTLPDVDTREVKNVCGVRFAASGRVYSFDAGDRFYDVGTSVVVDSDRHTRVGTVAVAPRRMADSSRSLKKILRVARPDDLADLERADREATEALAIARRISREVRLAGKVFKVDGGGKKWLVHVTSEERLDTREFARRLAAESRGRVEIRQTGVRDEARSIGGIGSCGRELCCTTWLPEFVPVSIKMAKDQGLVLNPTKVSGQCGRLKCCLVYEQDLYAQMRKGLPKLGKRVVTESGEGRVVEVDVLRQRIRVSLGPGQFEVFPASEVQPLFPSQQGAPKGKQ